MSTTSTSNNNNNSINYVNQINNNVILQTLKRRTTKATIPLDKVVTLDRVFGFTITSKVKLAQSNDGTIAYLAGCVVVLYDTRNFKQDFLISHARKTLTTLCFSADGRVIATGESGHDPKVRIWDIKEKNQLVEFSGHKYSIECVCFSPNLNSNLIISIGSVHDMVVNVWNYKTRFKVASNKIACKVRGISFSKDANYFVTVGNRHVKFWYLSISNLMETVPLKGRSAILSDMKNSHFCDVVCGHSVCSHLTFSITANGILCEFDENRTLRKVIELRVDRAYCIFADENDLYIGCSSGTILIFRQKNLDFIASLPRPHNLGVDISRGFDTKHLIDNLNNCDLKYPDCIALCFNTNDYYLCSIYNDHSLYIWDIKDVNKVKKLDSHLFHSSCCWSLDILANQNSNMFLPNDSFITCSSDNTLRIWSLESLNDMHKSNNIYSKELTNIIYIDNDLSSLCDIEYNQQDGNINENTSNYNSNVTTNNCNHQANNNEQQNQLNNIKLGARCLKISPFGYHLATGDRNGNIRVYDLKNLESIILIEAHESEILYLQYSQPESGRLLLASSSRDRLIHIFDAKKNYELIQTLDDHSAAITATRFCYNQIEKQFYLISCGSDKSIIFRLAQDIPSLANSYNDNLIKNDNMFESNHQNSSKLQFTRSNYVCEKMTFYDLVVDPTKNYINTVSQDRIVRTYSIKDGKKLRQFKGSLNEDGYLLKMDIDRTGSLLATSCTDKCVYIWDLNSCECLAYICGHSELIIDLKFTNDNKYLITIGVDSCIFVWNLNMLSSNLQHSISTTSFNRKSHVYNTTISTSKVLIDDMPHGFFLDNNTLDETNEYEKAFSNTMDSKLFDKNDDQSIFDNESSKKSEILKNNIRRSRAVWGPVCNTSFAIMVDNDIEEINDINTQIPSNKLKNSYNKINSIIDPGEDVRSNLSEQFISAVQFPSPNFQKTVYKVMTVDTNISKNTSLYLTIEDTKEDENQDIVTTQTKEIPDFCSPNKVLCNDVLIDQIMSPNSNDIEKKYLNAIDNIDSFAQRRQSLSARYLMKTQQSNNDIVKTQETSDDYLKEQDNIKVDSITSLSFSNKKQIFNNNLVLNTLNNQTQNINTLTELNNDLFKIKKNKNVSYLQNSYLHSQHTESSLNKVKKQQQIIGENTTIKKSPSINSIISIIENTEELNDKQISNENDSVKTEYFHNESSPLKVSNQETSKDYNNCNDKIDNESCSISNLKKASSMVSLNSQTCYHTHMSTSSSFNAKTINGNKSHLVISNIQNPNRINHNTINPVNSINHVTNSNALPPKTVRQVKQKSSDRSQNINNFFEKNVNFDKSRTRKLSNSIQNLHSIQITMDIQKNKSVHRCPIYAKNIKKQRSNTEEIIHSSKSIANDLNEENKNAAEPEKYLNNTSANNDQSKNEKLKTIVLSEKRDSKNNEKQIESDDYTWDEFGNNLVLLESIYKVRFENLNQYQKKQQKELLISFNKNTKAFIMQLELITEKNLKIDIN